MKKTISLIVSIVLTASLFVTTAFADGGLSNFQKTLTYTEGKFTDVSSSDWFSLNVETAYKYGLMNGRTTSTFGATENVTIAEVIVLAARLNSIYLTGSATFTTGTPWYKSYLDYCISNQITSAGKYSDYNANATRMQFAEIIAAALPSAALSQINTINVGEIPDVPLTGSYESVYKLYRAGIITGKTTAGEFSPADYILRSETAAIVARLANSDLRVQFGIVKAGSGYVGTQLQTTIDTASEQMDKALEYYNDAYNSATNGNFLSAGTKMDKASTYTQMTAIYIKSAADVCKTNSKYSAAYDGLYSTYQKCLKAMSGMSQLAYGSYKLTSDWESPRTLLNECSSDLIKSYVTIKDLG